MSGDLPESWPERPEGFYRDWDVFSRTLIGSVISRTGEQAADSSRLASLLLASGAGLGAAGMVALVEANREAIERRGQEWGIPNLARLLQGVGAAFGGFGGAMLTRMLSRQAKSEVVESIQDRLATIRRDFEGLVQDLEDGLHNKWNHRAAVEMLFMRAQASL